ncbi:MAG: Maf family protein [Deltaproteobacteria bacterium]|nr:Maf family protein [Deltaproteobacteria bacterium]
MSALPADILRQNRPLCLASTSPRRRELLGRLGLEFQVFDPRVDESGLPGETPVEHVLRLARLKAQAAREGHPGHGVLAGDTVVVLDGVVLGKPEHQADAARMLKMLAGNTHQVVTAYHLCDADTGEGFGRTVQTGVTFRGLPPEWLNWYSGSPEAADKAGAYGIQGLGGVMLARLEGSYTNVVGFPVEDIFWDLVELGWVSITRPE